MSKLKFQTLKESAEILNNEVRPYRGLKCAGGKCYLGSMFYLDFGKRLNGYARSGAPIELAELTLSVRDVRWKIWRDQHVVIESKNVSSESFSQFVQGMLGASVLNVSPHKRGVAVNFSNKIELAIDLSELPSDSHGGDILEFAMPTGRIFYFDCSGAVNMESYIDPDRAGTQT